METVTARSEGPGSSKPEIGPYRVLELLGAGGMGEVYLAEERGDVVRRVAVKVIKRGCDTEQTLRRFRIEQQALSLMNHPHIARVFGAGATEDGRPYFAMEHVPGIPITKYCDAQRLSTPERLRLFLQVCSGVQHAHLKGIVHRDLKPGNLLVSHRDGEPMAKVIDFGVAKSIDHRLIEQTAFTQKGQMVGTPAYMSPEQADLNQLGVDTRTDVYSLGVVLYELLVGQQPLSSEVLLEGAWADMQQRIRELTPPSPSTRLRRDHETGELAEKRRTDPTRLQRQIRGDLDVITMRALEKEPIRRFQSVSDLAADIERHLHDEPILARRPSRWYRARKFARRNRAGTLAAAVALSAVLVGGAVAWWNWRRAEHALGRTESALDRYELMSLTARAEDLAGRVDALSVSEGSQGQLQSWLDATRAVISQRDRVRRYVEELESAPSDGFLLERLRGLEGQVKALEANVPFVEGRLSWARSVRERTVAGYEDRWQLVCAQIGREYGFDLHPQVGLVPLGRNPDSRLWEFVHLRSAKEGFRPPPIDAKGLASTTDWNPDCGIVFVLLPVPDRPIALGAPLPSEVQQMSEGPLRTWTKRWSVERLVRLDRAFLISKYEVTQSQWERLTGDRRGYYGEAYSKASPWFGDKWPAHPVEKVTPLEFVAVLRADGMDLPSEDYWEYAARGGSTGLYWFPNGPSEEGRYPELINCSDRSRLIPMPDERIYIEDWDDGYPAHAPVATFEPNPFGLFHVLGNVAELCHTSDPEKESRYYARGGSFKDPFRYCSTVKLKYPFQDSEIGVRPVWSLIP